MAREEVRLRSRGGFGSMPRRHEAQGFGCGRVLVAPKAGNLQGAESPLA
jgi:hypothetical protein